METTKDLGLTCHDGGTMVTINGPRFSSKAESKMYRLWGADVVNMTTVPEVGVFRWCLIHCHICVILKWVYLNVV